MEDNFDSIKSFAIRGADAVLRFASDAGDKLRVASNNAIERLDAMQLEKKLSGLYVDLGKVSFNVISAGGSLSGEDAETRMLISEIVRVREELDRRRSTTSLSGKRKEN